MDARSFDCLTRSQAAGASRRRVVTALGRGFIGAVTLGLLGHERPGGAHARRRRRGKGHVHRRHDGNAIDVERKKRRKKKRRKHGAPSPPEPQLVYECPGPPETVTWLSDPLGRLAQTFTPSASGALHQIRAEIDKVAGTTGDYRLELVAVSGGIPSHHPLDVLAAATIPDAAVPVGDSTIIGEFSGPQLVPGTEYAVVVSRPGSTNLRLWVRTQADGGACTGQAFASLFGKAFEAYSVHDYLVSVVVT